MGEPLRANSAPHGAVSLLGSIEPHEVAPPAESSHHDRIRQRARFSLREASHAPGISFPVGFNGQADEAQDETVVRPFLWNQPAGEPKSNDRLV